MGQQKDPTGDQGTFALVSQITTNELPNWKRFNTLSKVEGDSFVETSITLSPISQPLYIGGGYRHSTSNTPIDVGVFRLYSKHLTTDEIKSNYNALADRYGKKETTRRRRVLSNGDTNQNKNENENTKGTFSTPTTSSYRKHQRRRLAYTTAIEEGTLDGGSSASVALIVPSFPKNMPDVGGLGDFVEICGISDGKT